METTYSRQSFLGPDSETIHHNATLSIVGLCGGGSHIAQQLAYVGIGGFQLFDLDQVSDSNRNRLVGTKPRDAKREARKTDVAARLIRSINPGARIKKFQGPWQDHAAFLRESNAIISCVDSFSEREQLEITARRYLIPLIDIGMDVHPLNGRFVISGQVVLSMPGEPCLRCFGIINETLIAQEAGRYGAAGGKPQVIWPNGVLASLAVGTLIQLLTPWHEQHYRSLLIEYDGNTQTTRHSTKMELVKNRACPHYLPGELGDPFWSKRLQGSVGIWHWIVNLLRK